MSKAKPQRAHSRQLRALPAWRLRVGTTREGATAFCLIGHQKASFPRRSCCWPPSIPSFYFGALFIHPTASFGELFSSWHSLAAPFCGEGEQQFCQAAGVVAGNAVFDQQGRAQGLDAQLAHGVEVHFDGRGMLSGVAFQKRG